MRIPPDHHPEILARAGKGASSEQIAIWLGTLPTPIKVSGRAIRNFLSKTKDFRRDAVQAAVREKLAPVAMGDLDELDAARLRAREIEKAAMLGSVVRVNGHPLLDTDGKVVREPELETALRAIRAQSDILDKRLHYAGAGPGNDDAPISTARDRLHVKLARLTPPAESAPKTE